jgi:PEP-CTERM motif
MSMYHARLAISVAVIGLLPAAAVASETPFTFSTGDPDGKMATAARPDTGGKFEIESADDFILDATTAITGASFTGLIAGSPLSSIGDVRVEIYRVFPKDSDVGRTNGSPTFSTPQVPTRVNSPSDVAFAERDTASSNLSFETTDLGSFTALNSVQPGGIHPAPGFHTGGDGAVTGEEVKFDVTFTTPLTLAADHYFFVPQVEVTDAEGNFFWLSALKPITGGTGPFLGDLQSWTRDEVLDPDWLRVGTDITGQGPFNAAFSLSGSVVPEPSTWAMMLIGFAGLAFAGCRVPRRNANSRTS